MAGEINLHFSSFAETRDRRNLIQNWTLLRHLRQTSADVQAAS
jgi:hypothetical protein